MILIHYYQLYYRATKSQILTKKIVLSCIQNLVSSIQYLVKLLSFEYFHQVEESREYDD